MCLIVYLQRPTSGIVVYKATESIISDSNMRVLTLKSLYVDYFVNPVPTSRDLKPPESLNVVFISLLSIFGGLATL